MLQPQVQRAAADKPRTRSDICKAASLARWQKWKRPHKPDEDPAGSAIIVPFFPHIDESVPAIGVEPIELERGTMDRLNAAATSPKCEPPKDVAKFKAELETFNNICQPWLA